MGNIGGSMKKKVLLKGPVLTRSGYGEQTRFALRSLRSREDLFDIYIQPITWGHTGWLIEGTEERKWMDETIEKTIGYIQSGGQFDISIQSTIPNEFERLAPINIGYTAGIETTKVAHEWIQISNQMDSLIVVSSHSAEIFKSTEWEAVDQRTNTPVKISLGTHVEHANYPVKSYDLLPDLGFKLPYDNNFLAVAQFAPRKNLMNTIRWFVEEFRDEEVGLIIKGNIAKNSLIDRSNLHGQLTNFVKSLGEKTCKVHLLHGDMSDEEMHALYRHPQIFGFVSFAHGEGFGLPLFEAAYSGLPVVSTGWSGQLDFLVDESGADRFYNVSYDLKHVQKEVVWDKVIVEQSMWAYPREASAKEQMRKCYEERDSNTAAEYAEELKIRFSEDNMYANFVRQIERTYNIDETMENEDDGIVVL